MTEAQKEIYKELFTRYGSLSDVAEIRITGVLHDARKLYDTNYISRCDDHAEEYIKQCEKAIEKLKIYRIAICERYNELQFANIQKVVKLKREKHLYDNKVYYYLQLLERYEDGHEEQIKSTRYTGKERKKALEDFENFVKENKNYIAVKDIEKGKWEK